MSLPQTPPGITIGIDLGAASICSTLYRNGRVELIPIDGETIMPSYVSFTDTGRLVGGPAKEVAASNPANTLFNVPRYLGRNFYDQIVQEEIHLLPFKIVKDSQDGKVKFEVRYHCHTTYFSPEEIITMLLLKVRAKAIEHLRSLSIADDVTGAVIVIPAFFNFSQRQAIRDCAAIAGLTVHRLLTGPAAAAICLAYSEPKMPERNVLVVDFGASKLDVAIVTIEETRVKLVAYAGRKIGGVDLDHVVMQHVRTCLQKKYNRNPLLDNMEPHDLHYLRQCCEEHKMRLSHEHSTIINIPPLNSSAVGYKETHTREQFEFSCYDKFSSISKAIDLMLSDAKVAKSDIDEIFMVGGSSCIPALQKPLGYVRQRVSPSMSLGHPAAAGAAIYTTVVGRRHQMFGMVRDISFANVNALSIMVLRPDRRLIMLIKPNTPYRELVPQKFTFKLSSVKEYEVELYEGEQTPVDGKLFLERIPFPHPASLGGNNDKTMRLTVIARIDDDGIPVVEIMDRDTGDKVGRLWPKNSYRLSEEELAKYKKREAIHQVYDNTEEESQQRRYNFQSHPSSVDSAETTDDEMMSQSSEPQSPSFGSQTEPEISPGDSFAKSTFNQFEGLNIDIPTIHLTSSPPGSPSSPPDSPAAMSSISNPEPGDSLNTWDGAYSHSAVSSLRSQSLCVPSGTRRVAQDVPEPSSSTPNLRQNQTQSTDTTNDKNQDLSSLFPPLCKDKKEYTDADFQIISNCLERSGQITWSGAPRLYTVLRLIQQLQVMDSFLTRGYTDIWLPLASFSSLPRDLLGPADQANFLKTQAVVLSKCLNFEKDKTRKHVNFEPNEPLPFKVLGLIEDEYQNVEKIRSEVSQKVYVRKRFKKGTWYGPSSKKFLKELEPMKRINNIHCVELVQSYTDAKSFYIIMSPAADYNLLEYYTIVQTSPNLIPILRGFLGCLACGIYYLHKSRIRHKDIKPANILVHGERVMLADFGISHIWDELSGSTTTSISVGTITYAAPELTVLGAKKNASSDIFSLGCVFLEIITVIKGETVDSMRTYFENKNKTSSYFKNIKNCIPDWIRKLRTIGLIEDDIALNWVESMLKLEHNDRPSAATLYDLISKQTNKSRIDFVGICCRGEKESDDSTEEGEDGKDYSESSSSDS